MIEDNASTTITTTMYPSCDDCLHKIEIDCTFDDWVRKWFFFRRKVTTHYKETRCARFYAYHPSNAREIPTVHFLKQEPGGLSHYALKTIPGPCGKEGKFFSPKPTSP